MKKANTEGESIWDAYNRTAEEDPWWENGQVNWVKAIGGTVGLVLSLWVWIRVVVPAITYVLTNG